MSEVEIMNWTMIGGILASLGALYVLVRDSQKLKSDHSEIRRENGGLSNEHKEILNFQVEAVKDFVALSNAVGGIKENLDRTQARIEQMNTSDKQVQTAVDTFSKFFGETQTQREQSEKKYEDLRLQYNQLVNGYNALVNESAQKEERITALEKEIQELKPETQARGLRGPSLRLK